jgi:hypothetical protein
MSRWLVQWRDGQVGTVGLSCVLGGCILPRGVECRQSVSLGLVQRCDWQIGLGQLHGMPQWQRVPVRWYLDAYWVPVWHFFGEPWGICVLDLSKWQIHSQHWCIGVCELPFWQQVCTPCHVFWQRYLPCGLKYCVWILLQYCVTATVDQGPFFRVYHCRYQQLDRPIAIGWSHGFDLVGGWGWWNGI